MPLMVNGVQLDITALNNASPVIKQVAADVQGLEQSAKGAGEGAAGASGELDTMAMSAKSLGAAVAVVTTGLTAMVTVFQWGEIAAGNERLVTSGEQLAESYGGSLDSILASVKETSLGTVSEMDIIASSNKAMMLGVSADAEELGNLMEIAALRGRAMGISTTQAFDDMVRGIGRMSPMILDNLGIVVDAEGTYARYATSIGKTASELTRAEKIQALLNKVLEEGNQMLEESGGLAEDNAAHYERWNAELENTKNYLLENTIGMSRFADMGAEALVVFRSLADEGIQYAGNPFLLALGVATRQVADHTERIREADAARWEGLASLYETTSATEALAGVTVTLTEVDANAVKGAIQVQETYDKYSEKLSDLQLDHEELLAKKQELIDQGWGPESEKIQTVNDKLAENEQKQKDVVLAMQGTLAQMLLNTAAAGLNAEGQLALARATGQIDEAAYAALSAQQALKKQYDDGKLTAQEYADRTIALREAIASLESKKVTVTVNAILNEIRNTLAQATGSLQAAGAIGGRGLRYAEGTEGWMTVPPGYPNDSYPIMVESGERFAVIPAGSQASPISSGGGLGGGMTVVFAPTIQNLFGSQSDMVNQMYPAFIQMLDQAKADGHLVGS